MMAFFFLYTFLNIDSILFGTHFDVAQTFNFQSLFLDLDLRSEFTNDQSSVGCSCRKVQRICFGMW